MIKNKGVPPRTSPNSSSCKRLHRKKTVNCLQLCPGTLPVVPAVLLGVLGVSGQDSSHGELVLKDSTGDIICEVKKKVF